MTPTASPVPAIARVAEPRRAHSKSCMPPASGAERVLGRYADLQGRPREVLTQPAAAGSVLVIDRDGVTLGDWRLVAHLAADEPPLNAVLVCRDYLSRPRGRWCRPVAAEDLCSAPFGEHRSQEVEAPALLDRQGCAYRLSPADTGRSIPELRWHRLCPAGSSEQGVCEPVGAGEPLGVREVVGALESYEPIRSLTVRALERHHGDPSLSTYTLRAELERLDASRIVLNRGLREAVAAAVASGSVSMSEITIRCGRVKRHRRAGVSGDTSWLARRVGLMPEGGRGGVPTPWVHSDVLALIARRGLGISPREVELG
ncbi:MAG: hypothetical protein ACHQDY_06880 [Solirubrobacterales bacterium]